VSLRADARGFDPEFFDRLVEVEDRHFWFRARNRVLDAAIRRVTRSLPDGYRALEIGCGTGNVLRVLERACDRGTVVGMDLFAEGLRHARRRVSCPLVRGDVQRPPFAQPFELIGLFDVLEHLPDDAGMLRSLRALLAPGGRLVLTVPAYRSLWSHFDEAVGHQRRYSPGALEHRLEEAGFGVDYLTPYMAAIFPLVWLGRRAAGWLGRGRPSTDLYDLRVPRFGNEILLSLLKPEARLVARRRRLPLGTSILAVARR
jgi:SAM-dependent methyltransferase